MNLLRNALRKIIGCDECKGPCTRKHVDLVLGGKTIARLVVEQPGPDYFASLGDAEGKPVLR